MSFIKNFFNASFFAGLFLDLLIAYGLRSLFDSRGETYLLFWYLGVVGVQYFFMLKNALLVFGFYLVGGNKHVDLIVDQFKDNNFPAPSALDMDAEEYLLRLLKDESNSKGVLQAAVIQISSLATLKASSGASRYVVGVLTLNKAMKRYREYCLKNSRFERESNEAV